MLEFFSRWHRSTVELNSHNSAGLTPSEARAAAASEAALEEVFGNPFEPPPPAPRRGGSSRMLQRSPHIRPDAPPDGYSNPSRLPFRVSVLRAGGLLHTFGGRRGGAAYADALNYEAMLALDENNVRRGVRKSVLDRLHTKAAGRGDAKHECHVCMEAFKRGHSVLQLPCEHRFCAECIQRWLRDHCTCPTCRWQFPDHDTVLVNLKP